MQKLRKYSGFTLIELLVVIAIIGILAAVVLVSLNSARAKSRDARRVADVHQMQTALELYYNDCGGYPATGPLTAGFKLISGTISGNACAGGGFVAGNTACAAATPCNTYLGQIPVNPTPGGVTYTYTQAAGAADYTITFTLEGQTGNLATGAHTATSAGLQ